MTFPEKKPGDELDFRHYNKLTDVAGSVYELQPQQGGLGIGLHRLNRKNQRIKTLQIEEIIDNARDEDGFEPSFTHKAWVLGDTNKVLYYLDATPFYMILDEGDLVLARYDKQRAGWIVIYAQEPIGAQPPDPIVTLTRCCDPDGEGSIAIAATDKYLFPFRYVVSLGVLGNTTLIFDVDSGTWKSPLLSHLCSDGSTVAYRATVVFTGIDDQQCTLTVAKEDEGPGCCVDPEDDEAPADFIWVYKVSGPFDPTRRIILQRSEADFQAQLYCAVGPCTICLAPQRQYTTCPTSHLMCEDDEDEKSAFDERYEVTLRGTVGTDCANNNVSSLQFPLIATSACRWGSVPQDVDWSDEFCKNDKNSDPFVCQPCIQNKGDFNWLSMIWVTMGLNRTPILHTNPPLPQGFGSTHDYITLVVRWSQYKGDLIEDLVTDIINTPLEFEAGPVQNELAIYMIRVRDWNCGGTNSFVKHWQHPDSAADFPETLIVKSAR